MTDFILNTTQSYTLVASAKTGNVKLFLDDDLSKKLAELVTADTSPEASIGHLLDLLGGDGPAYLDAIGQIGGVGSMFADAFAAGGMEGLTKALQNAGAQRNAGYVTEHFFNTPNSKMLPDNWDAVTGNDLADMLGFGLPVQDESAAGKDSSSDGGGEDIHAVIEGILADQEGAMIVWAPVVAKAAVALVVAVAGYVAAKEGYAKVMEEVEVDDGKDMPVDPNGDTGGGLTREEFEERVGEDDPLGLDPETTMPSPEGETSGGSAPSEEDLYDLDHYTQPNPENVEKGDVDLPEDGLLGDLDPWINPGNEDDPDFQFVDGFGAPSGGGLGGNGHDYVMANVSGVAVRAHVEVAVQDISAEPAIEMQHSPDDMIFL
ncbi:hypothetical protein V8J82_01010 [Gymnodinialimonas sp. 2305UL16-5]|uniref:hypothetical protein n=1 Tax=Gymnodinialimonas mytili TaxID=3126503 RepID=UPI0030AF8EC7